MEPEHGKRPDSLGAGVAIRKLRKTFGAAVAVDDVSLTVTPGEFLALLGPSGSGKSTILMSIAGFDRPTGGQVLIDGVDCTHIPTHRRNVGMVFQNYTLFPHLSVIDNVAFPLKMRRMGRAERRARAEAALERVRLGAYGSRMPNQLSGGQQQRVALARAIVYQPRLLLMDEPFSALDKKLREEMRLETKRLHSELGLTVVFVTHDQEEALTMADRVAVLKDGRLQQIGPARELYEQPANFFVADFIGNMNFISVSFDGKSVELPDGGCWDLPDGDLAARLGPGAATAAIRPERIRLTPGPGDLKLSARIQDVIYSGADTVVITTLSDGTALQVRTNSLDGFQQDRSAGQEIALYCRPDTPIFYPGRPA